MFFEKPCNERLLEIRRVFFLAQSCRMQSRTQADFWRTNLNNRNPLGFHHGFVSSSQFAFCFRLLHRQYKWKQALVSLHALLLSSHICCQVEPMCSMVQSKMNISRSHASLQKHLFSGITPPVVEFVEVSYTAPNNPSQFIFNNLSFSVHRGETLVLLGESGAGKTSLLDLINGLLRPSAGEVRVEGISVENWELTRLRRHMGYVMQEAGLFPHYTVAQNIQVPLELAHWEAEKKRQRVEELLIQVSLPASQFANRYPHELSGGQRQRVGVARALALAPSLLLLDEPFGALDPLTRFALQEEFLQLANSLHQTTVFVTHDLSEALRVGSHIGLLHEGQLQFLGTPTAFCRCQDPYVQAYLNTLRKLPLREMEAS